MDKKDKPEAGCLAWVFLAVAVFVACFLLFHIATHG